jgi:mycoredoxin-dependent peroxiredoxin
LRSFEQHLADFAARNTSIAAISVDSIEESRALAQKRGYTFPLLSDPQAATIRAYGVLHPHAGENGRDIARPAEFLVDSSGTIRWVNTTGSIRERLWPETVLRVIDTLPDAGAATPGSGS